MKGIVKYRVNARQLKNSSQPFSEANSETLGLLNITAEFEFDDKDVVLCCISGKQHRMAKATITKGGYADKAGQPPNQFWVCIDEPYVTLEAQAPTQFDRIVKCNQPIKAGDAIGFMGLYEVPKMPASSALKISKHQVHIELFTTEDDSRIKAFLNNEAGLKVGKQYVKIRHGASIYVKNEENKKVSFDTAGLKTAAEKICELNECKKDSDSNKAIYYKVSELPVLMNAKIEGYISEQELEILSQYDLAKLGFRTLEEKNTDSDGYLDPEKMPDFFQKLYKDIDKDGNGGIDSTEIAAAFKDKAKRDELVKIIAKHPSEWHKLTINSIKSTLSNWAVDAIEKETGALIEHEKARMDKLEWMSQFFSPMVWHFHPILFIKHLSISDHIEVENVEAKIRAFMRMIRVGEGTVGLSGYEKLFGGSSFIKNNRKTFSEHPQVKIKSNGLTSSAAGAYQVMGYTWNDMKVKRDKYGILDFSPKYQDLFCLVLLKCKVKGNTIGDIIGGNIKKAIENSSWEWASLPPGRYGQPVVSMNDALNNYKKYLDEELSGESDLAIEYGIINNFLVNNGWLK